MKEFFNLRQFPDKTGLCKNDLPTNRDRRQGAKCGTIKIIGKLFHKITDSSGTFEWNFACPHIIGLCLWLQRQWSRFTPLPTISTECFRPGLAELLPESTIQEEKRKNSTIPHLTHSILLSSDGFLKGGTQLQKRRGKCGIFPKSATYKIIVEPVDRPVDHLLAVKIPSSINLAQKIELQH